MENLIYLFLVMPAYVTGFTIHEFAHAWAGTKLGDDTARRQGRLTLDPMAHLDPVGFLIIVVAILFGLPLIGWAKPVPFNPRNLSNPRRDSILIAIAGPISNIIQAGCWLLTLIIFRLIAERYGVQFSVDSIIRIVERDPSVINSTPHVVAAIITSGVLLNILMAVFNMIPIPPLDGHWVLEGLGPPFISDFYDSIRPFSFFILIILINTPLFSIILRPFIMFGYRAILAAFGYVI